MTELDFKNEYRMSVESVPLPEDFKNRLLLNLKAEEKKLNNLEAPKADEINKKQKLTRRIFTSLIAAALVAIIGFSLWSLLMPTYEEVTLKVYSADTAKALSGVKITFRDSKGEVLKAPDGEYLSAVTDATGTATASLPIGKDYTAEISHEGYITYTDKAQSGNYYVSPILNENTYRAVLTWEKDLDLDAHLSVTHNGEVEKLFYFSSDIISDTGEVLAALDLDSEEANKPETVTFNLEEGAVFRYTVCSYSALENRESLSIKDAKARVTLYKGDKTLSVYELSGESQDNAWQVFEIENGELKNESVTYSVTAFTELR